jgi:hypothetical protein
MSDKLEEASIYDITSTSKPSGIIATHLASQNTLRRKHILSAPYTTLCRYYNITKKEPT